MALPIYNQPSLQWQIYNDPSNLVYQAGLDFTTYGAYTFGASGTVQQSVVQTQVSADGVGIDNSQNMNPVTVSVGNLFTETIPPFTKSLIVLGQSSTTVAITSTGGQAKATFYKGTYPGSIAQTNVLGATKQAIAVYLPPGLIMMFGGLTGTIPDGWLYCNGAAISRINYAPLFSVIGTKFGAGDNASTFNLPDMRAQFPRGYDDGRGIDVNRALGSTQAQNLPDHKHQTSEGHNGGAIFGQVDSNLTPVFGYETITGAVAFQATAPQQGGVSFLRALTNFMFGGQPTTDLRPTNVALLYMIKT